MRKKSWFEMLPGETVEEAAAHLGVPCETVQLGGGRSVVVVGRLSQAQIEPAHRDMRKIFRKNHPELFQQREVDSEESHVAVG